MIARLAAVEGDIAQDTAFSENETEELSEENRVNLDNLEVLIPNKMMGRVEIWPLRNVDYQIMMNVHA